MQNSMSLENNPWMLCGYFNQIIHLGEYSNHGVSYFNTHMLELRDCFMQPDLFALRYSGPPFTWLNKKPSNPIAKKLDRAMVNNHWLSSFPDSAASFLSPEFSDHAPCLLNLSSTFFDSGRSFLE